MVSFNLCYDRAGRSEGRAFVTYSRHDDALEAIREYDGANANGKIEKIARYTTPEGRIDH